MTSKNKQTHTLAGSSVCNFRQLNLSNKVCILIYCEIFQCGNSNKRYFNYFSLAHLQFSLSKICGSNRVKSHKIYVRKLFKGVLNVYCPSNSADIV